MIYMILVSPICIELYDFKKSYDHPCILSILLEFSWFEKRFSLSFQRVKLWVEFPIWIWYSKSIIELFKRFYRVYELSWDFKSFQAKLEFMRFIELMSFEVWCLFSHEFIQPLSREMSYSYETNVLSYELWVLEFEL